MRYTQLQKIESNEEPVFEQLSTSEEPLLPRLQITSES